MEKLIRDLQNINYWKEKISEDRNFSINLLTFEVVRGNIFLSNLVDADREEDLVCIEFEIKKTDEIVSYFKGVFHYRTFGDPIAKKPDMGMIFDSVISNTERADIILSMVYLDDTEVKYFDLKPATTMVMLNSKFYEGENIFGNLQEITRVDTFEFFEGGKLEEFLTS